MAILVYEINATATRYYPVRDCTVIRIAYESDLYALDDHRPFPLEDTQRRVAECGHISHSVDTLPHQCPATAPPSAALTRYRVHGSTLRFDTSALSLYWEHGTVFSDLYDDDDDDDVHLQIDASFIFIGDVPEIRDDEPAYFLESRTLTALLPLSLGQWSALPWRRLTHIASNTPVYAVPDE